MLPEFEEMIVCHALLRGSHTEEILDDLQKLAWIRFKSNTTESHLKRSSETAYEIANRFVTTRLSDTSDIEHYVSLLCAVAGISACLTWDRHLVRELMTDMLPRVLRCLNSRDWIEERSVHKAYMNCSYAYNEHKHDMKVEINRHLRELMNEKGLTDLCTSGNCQVSDNVGVKPTIMIMYEQFTCRHSTFRTHSAAVSALRSKFRVVGVGIKGATDEVSEKTFDECIEVADAGAVSVIRELATQLKPLVVFYIGVGLRVHTVFLSNIRLAPVQLVGVGHGASTFSEQIDGFVVEEDLIGNKACFSERVYAVPKGSMPFVPPAGVKYQAPERLPFDVRRQKFPQDPLSVRVAVCASVMKINPVFLETLVEIQRRSQENVQFCFYTAEPYGLVFCYVQKSILDFLPGSEVNTNMKIQEYQKALNGCDMFVSPFPYGNMNGVVDTARQGLPGVCMTGPEIHASIDGGLFRRVGLPEELIAGDTESYITATVRLVNDTKWREELQQQLLHSNIEHKLFSGEPEKFVETIWQIACGEQKKNEHV